MKLKTTKKVSLDSRVRRLFFSVDKFFLAEIYQTYADRGLPGSLRIGVMRPKQKETLSLASYIVPSAMPENARATVPPPGVNGKNLSAAAIRDAAYAERDRNRGQDPGPALDFIIPEDDEDDEDEDDNETKNEPPSVGQKARKQALRILQASSTIPEEGMWRSLA